MPGIDFKHCGLIVVIDLIATNHVLLLASIPLELSMVESANSVFECVARFGRLVGLADNSSVLNGLHFIYLFFGNWLVF